MFIFNNAFFGDVFSTPCTLIARFLIPATASFVISKTHLTRLIFGGIIARVLNLLKVAYLTIAFSQSIHVYDSYLVMGITI